MLNLTAETFLRIGAMHFDAFPYWATVIPSHLRQSQGLIGRYHGRGHQGLQLKAGIYEDANVVVQYTVSIIGRHKVYSTRNWPSPTHI